jgi:hypothetical protein
MTEFHKWIIELTQNDNLQKIQITIYQDQLPAKHMEAYTK